MLQVEHLVKSYPAGGSAGHHAPRAADDVTFDVEAGQLFTLLGPSGCGKTTTLRCIAGLAEPDLGELQVAGRPVFSAGAGIRVPANRRGIGMVFQSYAIWPHMDVHTNVAFALQVLPRGQRPSRRDIRQRVERVLAVVRLDHLAGRRATELSGWTSPRGPDTGLCGDRRR